MEPCCPQRLEQISAALDGELSPLERRDLDDHLAACSTWTQFFSILAQQSQALRSLEASPPRELADSILARLPHRRRWRLEWVVCAVLGLALGLPLLPWSGGSAAPEAATAQSLHIKGETAQDQFKLDSTEEPAEAGAGVKLLLDVQTRRDILADATLTLSAPPSEKLAHWDSLPGGTLADGTFYRMVDLPLLERVLEWAGNTTQVSATLHGTLSGADGVYVVYWSTP